MTDPVNRSQPDGPEAWATPDAPRDPSAAPEPAEPPTGLAPASATPYDAAHDPSARAEPSAPPTGLAPTSATPYDATHDPSARAQPSAPPTGLAPTNANPYESTHPPTYTTAPTGLAPSHSPAPTGLGSRPSHAPEMIAPPPGAMYAPYTQPDTDDRPWSPETGVAVKRGPIVLLAVGAVVLLAVIAIVGVFLIQGPDPREPGDAIGADPPIGVPAPPFEERLHASELYDKDWDFRLEKTTGFAKLVNAWDYDDCTAAALFSGDNDTLVGGKCEYRIEGAYVSKDGHTRIAEQVLVFADEQSASNAALELDWSAYAFQPDGTVSDALMSGGSIDANKQYLIVTVATIDTRDDAVVADAEKLLHLFHTDHVSVFYFR